MPDQSPKISIITAAYQCVEFLQETYESIASQSVEDWEWVIVDDASEDGTPELLRSLAAADRRVKVIRNIENFGAAFSRNRAIDAASGEYLAFIDSDDLWAPKKLERQLAFFSPEKAFTFTGYNILDEEGYATGKQVDVRNVERFDYRDMLAKRATLGCSTVMIRRAAIGNIRMPNLRTGQDYAFWLKLLKTGMHAYLLPEPLTSYRIRQNSLSRNKARKALQQWKIYRDVEGLQFSDAAFYFLSYAIRAISR